MHELTQTTEERLTIDLIQSERILEKIELSPGQLYIVTLEGSDL